MNALVLLLGRWVLLAEMLAFGVLFLKTPRRLKKRFFLVILISGCLALLLATAASFMYHSPRPYDVEHLTPVLISSHVHSNGFPSSHGLLAFTLAWLALSRSKKVGAALILLAIAVAVGRVVGHVHHVVDFVGSASIAAVAVLIVLYVERNVKFHNRRSSKSTTFMAKKA